MAKHKAMRGPIKVGDTGEFGKYGKNDNFARIANMAKHKVMRGAMKVGDTYKFGKYGENDNETKHCLKMHVVPGNFIVASHESCHRSSKF